MLYKKGYTKTMVKFDLDKWWLENVGPYENVMDLVYKKITRDALDEIIKLHDMQVQVEEKKKEEAIDLDDLDLSDVLDV
jgi:hypothetical protein